MIQLPVKYQRLNDTVLEIYQQEYLEMSDGAKLRNLSYRPENPKGTLLFVPGWISLPITWGNVLPVLAENNYHVEYLESREKYTAKLPKNAKITKRRMIQDKEDAVELLGLKQYISIASSLGSTILVDAMLYSKINPHHAVLLNIVELGSFDFRRVLTPFINSHTYNRIAKPRMKNSLRKTYLNIEQDLEQYEKYALALDFADPDRARRSLNAWYGNKTWDHLSELENKCTIVVWGTETLHQSPRVEKIVAEHENLDLVIMGSHKEAHDEPLVDLIESLTVES